jgi:hypothetical protein
MQSFGKTNIEITGFVSSIIRTVLLPTVVPDFFDHRNDILFALQTQALGFARKRFLHTIDSDRQVESVAVIFLFLSGP